MNPDVFRLYAEVCVYYDVTDSENPIWKFFFNPKSLPWRELEGGRDDPQQDLCYKAEIDAHTGEVTEVEEFEFQMLGQDIDYDLKWY